MMEYVREFFKKDDSIVNSPTVIATFITAVLTALAIPVTILGMFAVYHHVWVLNKGLDSSVTTLLLGLAGGGGVGMGAGYAAARFSRGYVPMAKPAPPE